MQFVRSPLQDFLQLNSTNRFNQAVPANQRSDIYLNIEISPIFSPAQGNSLKNFNRKLKQSLKEREISKAVQASNSHFASKIQKIQSLIRNQQHIGHHSFSEEKIYKDHTRTEFSPFRKKQTVHKKFSFQTKPNEYHQKSILSFPLIKEDFNEQVTIFDRLISSESSKGLIERLLKRKKEVSEQEKTTTLFRYPFNRKIFNKMNSKSQTIKCSNTAESSMPNARQKGIEASIKQSSCRRINIKDNFNLILSPNKKKQIQASQTRLPLRKFTKPTELLVCGQEQIGPWNEDSHPSLDN